MEDEDDFEGEMAERRRLEKMTSAVVQGYLASFAIPDTVLPTPQNAARTCVSYAKALLAELDGPIF